MKKLLKKKFKQILAISMALSMILCTNAFATPIDLVNSTESVATDTLNKAEGTDYFDDEDTNVWEDGQITERVDVTVQRESQFEVTIPKDIVLDGETGIADYIVNAKGDIAGNQKLSVVPDAEFEMTEAGGKDSVTATVTQNDTEYTYQEMLNDGTDYPGSVKATLTAGEWEGSFNFNISFEDVSHIHSHTSEITKNPTCIEKGIKTYICSCGDNYTEDIAIDPNVHNYINGVCECGDKILEGYSWAEIAEISESGEAANYFSVGDTKSFTLSNGETYNAEIIGFNHDDLADGTGKAGVTFQFKELMTTEAKMNDTSDEYPYGDNIGGWEASEMRNYVNNNVYTLLPAELQAEIKEVDKVSDAGNMDTSTLIHTSDKLFLLSLEEVGLSYSSSVTGQGEKYEIYSDNASRIKYLSGSATNWWLRSAYTNDTRYFLLIGTSGGYGLSFTAATSGVAPAFCI